MQKFICAVMLLESAIKLTVWLDLQKHQSPYTWHAPYLANYIGCLCVVLVVLKKEQFVNQRDFQMLSLSILPLTIPGQCSHFIPRENIIGILIHG